MNNEERARRVKKRIKIVQVADIFVIVHITVLIWIIVDIYLKLLTALIVIAFFMIQMGIFIWLIGRRIKEREQEEKSKPKPLQSGDSK